MEIATQTEGNSIVYMQGVLSAQKAYYLRTMADPIKREQRNAKAREYYKAHYAKKKPKEEDPSRPLTKYEKKYGVLQKLC